MSEMRTEEEQVEALKGWWKENGKSLVIMIAIALSAVFGWKTWQQKQLTDAETASITYQNLLDAVSATVGKDSADQVATSQHLGSLLKAEHESTEYARFAALLMARIDVDQEKYSEALQELDWVLAHKPSAEMQNIVLLRKARIYQAMGEFEKGLSVVVELKGKEFSASASELKGDLLLASGKNVEARRAYQQAIELSGNAEKNPLLTMKLEDLATSEEG
ncbi:Putative negative regulator of RcsB-dependent stress response [Neptunomonas antarctica]|uniref:Ancillary SecYEG translocon subunit n=2 Tax=Neptunomonas antarctica TaxID=619304 RepID=A0A1N7P780_9GAMM|nr:Putative negative regulator of RcsB-dependent stress response [Neptunomonas antarctica]